MEQLVSFAVVAIVTGFFAQAGKGHVGAIWGLISLPVQWIAYEIFSRAARSQPDLGALADLVVALASGVISALVMLLIVLTLPNRKPPPPLK
jgi:hypothetical protein